MINRSLLQTASRFPLSATQTGWVLALASILLFSANAPMARFAFTDERGMPPLMLNALAFVITSVFVMLFLALSKQKQLPARCEALDRRGILVALVAGGLNGFTWVFFFLALDAATASLTSLVFNLLYPTATLLLLMTSGEAFSRDKQVRLLMAIVGLMLLLGVRGNMTLGGALLIMLAAACYATHLSLIQWFLRPYHNWHVVALTAAGAMLASVGSWGLSGFEYVAPTLLGWLLLVYQGVGLGVVGRVLIYGAIKRIGSGQIALLEPLGLLLTVVWSVLFLNEQLVGQQWVGAACVMVSYLVSAVPEGGWREMPLIRRLPIKQPQTTLT